MLADFPFFYSYNASGHVVDARALSPEDIEAYIRARSPDQQDLYRRHLAGVDGTKVSRDQMWNPADHLKPREVLDPEFWERELPVQKLRVRELEEDSVKFRRATTTDTESTGESTGTTSENTGESTGTTENTGESTGSATASTSEATETASADTAASESTCSGGHCLLGVGGGCLGSSECSCNHDFINPVGHCTES